MTKMTSLTRVAFVHRLRREKESFRHVPVLKRCYRLHSVSSFIARIQLNQSRLEAK